MNAPMTTRSKILIVAAVVVGAFIAPRLGLGPDQIGQAIIGFLIVVAWISQNGKTDKVHEAVNGKNDALLKQADELRAQVLDLEHQLRLARGSSRAIEAPPVGEPRPPSTPPQAAT